MMKKLLYLCFAAALIIFHAPTSAEEGVPESFQAHLIPYTEAVIASQYAGKIMRIPLKNGDVFKKGDTLVAFDCRLLRSEYKKVQAELKIAEAKLESNMQLQEYQSIGKLEVDIAKAEAEKARVEVEMVKIKIGFCTVKAPFAGKVVTVSAHPFESVGVGDSLMEIVASREPEIRLFIPSHLIKSVKPGAKFLVAIDETGTKYPATITRIGGRIDPVSQTIDVYGTFIKKEKELIPGMSGSAHFTNQ